MSRNLSRFFSLIAISNFAVALTACEGMTSRSGAVEVESLGSANISNAAGQCHYDTYKSTVSPIVMGQCLGCHGNSGNGSLLLQSGGTDAIAQNDYDLISSYIESSAATPDDTSLMGRIGGGLSHPLKFQAGSSSYQAFESFVSEVQGDPDCTGTTTGTGGVIGI